VNIVKQGGGFVQRLVGLKVKTEREWRECPRCGGRDTIRNGGRRVRPQTLEGRREERVQRHWCRTCRRVYEEESAERVRGSWYGRDVRRMVVDLWQHDGVSVRKVVELVRALVGKQERWGKWRPGAKEPGDQEKCHLSVSTVERWLVRVGEEARRRVPGQLEGVPMSGQMGVDGLWVRLRKGKAGSLLALVDRVTGVVLPPIVVPNEIEPRGWKRLFRRAMIAGVDPDQILGVVSDGALGLRRFLLEGMEWVNHQRCVFHLWRELLTVVRRVAKAAAADLTGAAADELRQRVRTELVRLLRAVFDASSEAAAQLALSSLQNHSHGAPVAAALAPLLEAAFVHTKAHNHGLGRTVPEWIWRDYRLRLSHGRNHGSVIRQEQAAVVWAIYHNFTPAQWRQERKRHYRHPGQSPFQVAGLDTQGVSYLDALLI
jgi:transposase-like protein